MALTLVVAACGDDGAEGTTGTDPSTSTTVPAPSTTAGTTTTFEAEAIPDDAPDAARVIEHARGTAEVPGEPSRIVVLDSGITYDSLVALGLGEAIVARGRQGVDAFWTSVDPEPIELVGEGAELNLEAIAAARPDLIIGTIFNVGEAYDELAQIAPTVASPCPTRRPSAMATGVRC